MSLPIAATRIYKSLRDLGAPHTLSIGLVANFMAESGCESCRLQGDFSADRIASKIYARRVDEGGVSSASYANDSLGWGLAQWTFHTRKQGLLSYCKAHGKSIADEASQLEYCLKELRESYPGIWEKRESLTVEEATKAILIQYEAPAVLNENARLKYATEVEAAVKGLYTPAEKEESILEMLQEIELLLDRALELLIK